MYAIIFWLIFVPVIFVLSLYGLKQCVLRVNSSSIFKIRRHLTDTLLRCWPAWTHLNFSTKLSKRLGQYALLLALALTGTTLVFYQAGAANPNGDLRIQVITAYNFIVDSNVESPSTYAPEAATIGAQICNDGANDLTEAFVQVGNFDPDNNGNPSDSTPGIYPSRIHSGLSGTFSLVHEGGSAGTRDATRYLGTIPAGQCITQYWLIGYPRLDANGNSVTGGIKPQDDLWLEYDIWATANDGGTSLLADQTRRATMRNEISAAANKIWPNGDNKVPDVYKNAIEAQLGWDTITPSGGNAAYPGELIRTQGIWYDFGVAVQGFDNNLDLVPDQNAWAQPVGDPNTYDPGCFRLVRTYGIIIVKLKSGGEYLIPFENQLYFENLPDNTGVVGLVYYEYEALDGVCTASLTPYQEVASGSDNEKFNGDYGHFVPPVNSQEPTVELNKIVDQTTVGPTLPVTLTYGMQFTNTGAITVGHPEFAAPLVVEESIPTGTIYIAGSAAVSNTLPPSVSGYDILYSTNHGTSWTLTEPSAASVTTIQWWLKDPLPPGEGGIVRLRVTLPSTYTGALVNNLAGLSYGNTGPFTQDNVTTMLVGVNNLGDTVFADNGSGGGTAGNGVRDGSEAGIANITVNLYYDANSDGIGDNLISTTTTSAAGAYSFNNLPDGRFVVVVDTADSDLPAGYSPTTASSIPVDLDSAQASSSAVSNLNADFGFSPALLIDKNLISGSPLYEGRTVQYTLNTRNLLPNGAFNTDYWATSAIVGTEFINSGNVVGAPDNQTSNQSGSWPQNSGSDMFGGMVKGSGFMVAACGAITKVEALYHLRLDAALNDDELHAIVRLNGTDWYNYVISPTTANANFVTAGGATFALDITTSNMGHTGSVTNWATWDNSPANEIQIGIEGEKQSGAEGRILYVDAIGVRITNDGTPCTDFTSATVLNPVPLTDTYNPAKLQYVSASITPNTVNTTSGTITWSNIGPLNPGDSKLITLTFKALEPTGNISETITNTASITQAYFANGVAANTTNDSAAATLQPTGSISGVIWSEGGGTNGWAGTSGYETGTDFFVSGVTVTLYSCTSGGTPLNPASVSNKACSGAGSNGGTWSILGTTTTDKNGGYLFEGLFNGFYVVTVNSVSLPGTVTQRAEAGTANTNEASGGRTCGTCDNQWGDTSQNLNTTNFNPIDTSGEVITNVNFGYTVAPAIYGQLWQDNDGDGQRDAGENNFGAGITVTLTDNLGNVTNTTTTTAGGYQFSNLATGRTYTVTVATINLPGTGWSSTADPDAVVNGVYLVGTLSTGQIAGSFDFGFHQTGAAAIGDTLFYDWDADGVQDAGDEGVPSITVYLYEDSNGDGVIDPTADASITTTTTSLTGTYRFSNLAPGNYIVTTHAPAGTVQTKDPDETGLCSGCDLSGKVSGLSASTFTDTVDFGFLPVGEGLIGDTVWYDKDGNGSQSGTQETGLAGVTVELWIDYNGDGVYSRALTTTTTASGRYLFDNLPDGAYQVRVDTSDPYLPNDAFGNNYIPTTATTTSITVANGSTHLNADFGFTALGAVGDTIYWDANGDGELDWNESGISGVSVTLSNASTQTLTIGGVNYAPNAVISTTTTLSNGTYLFQALPPGRYAISVITTTSPINSAVLTGDPEADGVPCTDASATGCDSRTIVTLAYGTNYMGADFGYQAPGAFGDFVWFDQDGDGLQDGGEVGIAGVVVTATTTADVTVAGVNHPAGTTITTTTDYDGYYSFANLISNGSNATWTVTVATPANMAPTFDPDGTANAATTVTINTSGAVVVVGGNNCTNCALAVDFGFELDGPYSLSGSICLETSGSTNGVCGNPTDTQVPTYTLYLYDSSGHYLGSTTTNASGAYTFTNLISDTYYVAIGTTLPPLDVATLTTTDANTPASAVTRTSNTVYQTVAVNPTTSGSDGGSDANRVEGLDFAFVSSVNYDFGDLPQSYNTTLQGNPSGPRHTVPATPTLYLGSVAPDYESNGLPGPNADSDGSDEEGIVPVNLTGWVDGTNGGSVRINVTGSGWLVGWIDFNADGDLTDSGEMVTNRPVSTGVYTLTFNIPSGTMTSNTTGFYSRFRLFTAEPPMPLLAYSGAATAGEVEDYFFDPGATYSIGNYVWLDWDGDGIQGTNPNEAPLPGVVVDLYAANGTYLTSTTTLTDGAYLFADLSPNLAYTIQLSNSNFLASGVLFDYLSVPLNAGTAATDSNADSTALFNGFGYAVTTTLTITDNLSLDFGFQPTVDLALSKGVDNLTPNVGDTITFTLTLTNSGVYTATGVQVSDALPAGLSYVSNTPGQGSYNNGSGVWNVGTVPTNTTITLTLVATVATSAPITNTAQVTTTTNLPDRDSTPGNNLPEEDDQDSVFLTPQQADLSLTKQVDSNTPYVGNTITFTIVVSNAGPNNATNVTVSDPLPGVVTYNTATPSQGSYNNGSGLWTVGTITANTTISLTVVTTVTSGNTFTNTAQITASDQFDPDSTPNNDNPSEDDQDSVVITATRLSTITGQVRNDTDGDGNIADPDSGINGVTIVLYTDPNGDGDPSDGTAILTATTAITGGYVFTNVIPGKYVIVETDPSNYSSTADTDGTNDNWIGVTIIGGTDSSGHDFLDVQQADLSLTKQVDNGTPLVGNTITFTLVVSNAGPNNATNVTVSDPLPAEVTYQSNTPSQGSYSSGSGLWTIGTITANTTVSLTIVAMVNNTTFTNTAQITTSDQYDPDSTPGNDDPDEDDQDFVKLPVGQADLSLDKAVNDNSLYVGDTAVFTITVTNAGPNDATNVRVEDALPAGLTYAGSQASLGNYVPGTNLWTIGTIAANISQTLSLTVTVSSAGRITNTAQVERVSEADPNSTPDNDNPSEDDQDSVVITATHLSTITGQVRNDTDGDGSFADPDSGINGVTIALYTDPNGDGDPSDGTAILTATTTLTGGYVFTNVIPGDYVIVETDLNNYSSTTDTDGTNDNWIGVTIIGGTDSSGNDFLDVQRADLSLTKQVDNTSPYVGSIITFTIVVSNAGPNNATNVTVSDPLPGAVNYKTATPSQGSYTNGSGLWTVGTITANTTVSLTLVTTVTSATPFTNTAEVKASDAYDPDSTPDNNASEDDRASVLVTGQATGSIGDTVFLDADGDGQIDAGEGVSGITVTLTLSGGSVLTDVTDANGQYTFTNLPAGTYTVTVSTGGTGLAGLTNTVDPDGGTADTAIVTLSAGQNNLTQDFGYFEPLRLGSQVWHDLNNNGNRDNGEPGLSGVQIDLYRQITLGVFGRVATTTTVAGGFYQLTNLPNGTYYLNLPSGNFNQPDAPLFSYLSSTPTVSATTDTLDNNDNGNNNLDPPAGGISTDPFTLTANAAPIGETGEDNVVPDNDSNLTVDLGVFERLSLGNRVWFDINNNGVVDPNETGVPGVIVNLLRPNGAGSSIPVLDPITGQPRQATTDGSGTYFFDRLEPGDYILQLAPVNFQTGGVLDGYYSSAGDVDPDNNDNNSDDNGRDEDEPDLYGIFSDPITLALNGEPTNDGDSNSNTNFSVDFGVQTNPTAIDLLYFTSRNQNGQVRLEWATAVEYDNFGFRLLRSETDQLADAVEVSFVPGQGKGTVSGAAYTYLDGAIVQGRTYTYWLVDVDFNGTETTHSETTRITPAGSNPTVIYLPLIMHK